MKFTTPCFVCVENAEKRKELLKWLESIGRKSELYDENDDYIMAENWESNYTTMPIRPDANFGIDCGEDIELFKAMSAMNDENWDKQYVVDNAGNWGFCEIIPDAGHLKCRCVTMLGVAFNIDNYRKATAEEIVEHFKNREK